MTPLDASASPCQNDTIDNSPSNVNLDWAYLPKPSFPSKEELQPVEKFVSDAIVSRRAQPPSPMKKKLYPSSPSNDNREKDNNDIGAVGYRAILDLMRKKDDLPMLRKVFLALLRTNAIEMISNERSKHNRLIHYIFRLNPFIFDLNTSIKKQKKTVIEKRKKGEAAGKDMLLKDEDYTLGETYLNFVVALTSANSVFLTPTLNSLWRLIMNIDAITSHDRNLYLSSATFTPDPEKSSTIDIEDLEIEKQIFMQHQLKINSLLHGALRKILQLVPKGKFEIYSVIASSFPFKLAPLSTQVNYMKQSLIVLQYVQSMTRQFLELCVDKCLEIDVEIRIGNNGNVKIEENKIGEDDDGDDQQATDIPNDCIKEQKIIATAMNKNKTEEEKVDEMAEKLDTLMFLIFEHLQSVASSNKKSPRQLYKMLLPSFESVILTTHRCKFVQFIVLYLCGLDERKSRGPGCDAVIGDEADKLDQPQLFREFASKLIDIVLDPYRATVTRQSAACYLASFISRTSCVCAETACEAVGALLRFAEAYMDTFPTEVSVRNARRYLAAENYGEQESSVSTHSLFFTICQAAFYIMCFRGKECVQYYNKALQYHSDQNTNDVDYYEFIDPKLIDITSTRWDKVCSHHLNPLRFCLESVRGEFLFLAKNFELLNDDLLRKLTIENEKMISSSSKDPLSIRDAGYKRGTGRKRRKASSIQTAATLERRRVVGGVGGLGTGSNPLDSFFPFDPYLLRRSYLFIEPNYKHWTGSSCVDSDYTESDDSGISDSSVNAEEEEEDDDVKDFPSPVKRQSYDNVYSDDEAEKEKEMPTAVSLTSATTTSMGGGEWTDDLSDSEFNAVDNAETSFVNELKRVRGLSIGDECW